MVRNVIEQTGNVTLITDGERRYGSLLFEICHEVFRSGRRGRPPKVLREGIKIRIKNKGRQNRKRGRKRSKYETPHAEHPQTLQNITNKEIHANHADAFNASIRSRCSAYRRRTNMYAKNKAGIQRVLDGVWIVHQCPRETPPLRAGRKGDGFYIIPTLRVGMHPATLLRRVSRNTAHPNCGDSVPCGHIQQ
ncbi:hypothetical protein CCP3SC1_30002 [Gammaproteobacteria bacterium]